MKGTQSISRPLYFLTHKNLYQKAIDFGKNFLGNKFLIFPQGLPGEALYFSFVFLLSVLIR